MPKTMYVPADAKRSGVDVTWTPSRQRLVIGGWYDSICGLDSEAMTLREFFERLGITEKDCRKAWKAK